MAQDREVLAGLMDRNERGTNEIYFDNSATTRPYKEVCDVVAETMYGEYGNASSLHRRGLCAERILQGARETVAGALSARADEITFTSGGTESANLAILGVTAAVRGRHVITTPIEHPCVRNPFLQLEKNGYEVTWLQVDENGFVDLDHLERALREDTALVSVMHVNNEVGSIAPLEEISRLVRQRSPRAVLMADAVQSFGKLPLRADWCDVLTVSAHKIHGPKGIGALYLKKGTRIRPILFGGGQENNLRPGTENIPAIAGFAEAVRLTFAGREEKMRHVAAVKNHLAEGIVKTIPDTVINNQAFEKSAPSILNVSFLGVRSETLLHFLEERGISVSSGSACSSNKPELSHVLLAMGCQKNRIDSAIRFSFCAKNTLEEADRCLAVLREVVPQIRETVRYRGQR